MSNPNFCDQTCLGTCQCIMQIWPRSMKGHNSGTNIRKNTCHNPKLDLVNMNACIKFGENIVSSGSQDIERKQNFGVNKDPLLWYKFAKNDV